jgi:hypothetical protein
VNADDALARLRAAGVDLWLEGDALRYRAPSGVLAPERLDWLREHKPELIEALRAPPPAVDGEALGRLYAELFEAQARRAMVSLDSRQVRRAVDMGALDPVLAAASVVVAYRSGEARCLLAVPREKHDGLAIVRAFHETTDPAPCAHAGSGSTTCA